ncbi:Pentatricopeptide repeat-containing protein [Hibiscus syriacus]|uniref:Pentatricopeptide repeat-containing protein n=1 Tax=Hibiscus syriacus TaxID=106335 RepID=A0A6A3C3J4_HIBSY|nr:Pentatricopeptide repeat-containing protein [Hibiscus syriacus]
MYSLTPLPSLSIATSIEPRFYPRAKSLFVHPLCQTTTGDRRLRRTTKTSNRHFHLIPGIFMANETLISVTNGPLKTMVTIIRNNRAELLNQDQGYSQRERPNQWNPLQNRSYPQYPNANPMNTQMPISPNQWNNRDQNQGYPQGRNYNERAPQSQNPNQPASLRGNQGQMVEHVQTEPVPSLMDLTRLCHEGKVKEAIELMGKGVKADANCFSSLFELIGNPKSLEDAKKVHDYFLQSTCQGDPRLNNKVIEMYVKCASITDARRIFDHMIDRNMDTWHLMINGYADNGLGDDGLQLFEQMRNFGLKPTEQTFLAVLSACGSAEAIEEGFLHFQSMESEYGISPGVEHYMGLIGVLGKSGHLYEAKEYIEKKLPFKPTVEVWEALRNYARIHGEVDLEDYVEELIVDLDPSKVDVNKIPTPSPKKRTAISMLDGRN